MGNSTSKQLFTSFREPLDLSKFSSIQQWYAGSLGEVHEFSNDTTNQRIFMKNIKIDKEILQEDIKFIRHKLDISHPAALQTYGYTFFLKPIPNGSQTEGIIYFEPPYRTLQCEIEERRQKQEALSWELLTHLRNCIGLLALMEENECNHGHISTETIFFSDDNHVKLLNPIIMQLEDLAAYVRTHMSTDDKKNALQDLTDIPEKSFTQSVFDLGITFLTAALLEDEARVRHSFSGLNPFVFSMYTEDLASAYSPDFINLLRHMTDKNELRRPTFIELRDNINDYMRQNALGLQDLATAEFPVTPGQQSKVISFPNTDSLKPSKSIQTGSVMYTDMTSPRRSPKSLLRGIKNQEWTLKKNKSSLFDRVFCGACSTNT